MDIFDKILIKYWGYDSFRPLQKEIITSIFNEHDTLALMPTGGGKSITYQVPAIAMEGICIVITPLISLMKDQVDTLKSKNIRALCVHSGMNKNQIDITLDNAVYGNYKLLYISPERAKTTLFKERFRKMNVSFLAIDEAHCVSQWGYDFRPNYMELSKLREIHPDIPIVAVTASATEQVCEDIICKLKLKSCSIFKKSFARKNLSYLVRYTEDKETHLFKILDSLNGVGIIYCALRKECDSLAELLIQRGYSAGSYHGGKSYEMRSKIQEDWMSEKIKVIVATNAFGMGVDKSNVRFVVHYSAPESLEAYYQEAGRAGRDEKSAFAILLHDDSSRKSAKQHLVTQYPKIDKIREIYQQIFNYLNYGIGEGKGNNCHFNVFEFCSKYHQFSSVVISTIAILEQNDYMYLSEPKDNPPMIQFTVNRDDLYNIQIRQRHINEFIQSIMRLYSGIFSSFVKIDISYITAVTGYSADFINECLITLGRMRILNYVPAKYIPVLFLNEERLEIENLRIAPETYVLRQENSEKRLEAMFEFIDRTDKCRSLLIQKYFGEDSELNCGLCDICRKKNQKKNPETIIINILNSEKLDINQIVSRTGLATDIAIKTIELLINTSKIELISGFYYQKKS